MDCHHHAPSALLRNAPGGRGPGSPRPPSRVRGRQLVQSPHRRRDSGRAGQVAVAFDQDVEVAAAEPVAGRRARRAGPSSRPRRSSRPWVTTSPREPAAIRRPALCRRGPRRGSPRIWRWGSFPFPFKGGAPGRDARRHAPEAPCARAQLSRSRPSASTVQPGGGRPPPGAPATPTPSAVPNPPDAAPATARGLRTDRCSDQARCGYATEWVTVPV